MNLNIDEKLIKLPSDFEEKAQQISKNGDKDVAVQ
jgi:hypothetical protein